MMFSSSKRDAIKKSNPEATFGEVGRLLGAAWAKCTQKEKDDWTKKAATQTAKYLKEFNARQKK